MHQTGQEVVDLGALLNAVQQLLGENTDAAVRGPQTAEQRVGRDAQVALNPVLVL